MIATFKSKRLVSVRIKSSSLGSTESTLMFVLPVWQRNMIFTYGSLVPEKSFAGRSAARMIVTARCVRRKSYPSRNCIRSKLSSALFEPACLTEQSSKSAWVGRDCSATNSFDVVVDVDVFGVSLKPDTFCQLLIMVCYHFLFLCCETAILLYFAQIL